jgi:oxygen-dependent protoporphyrinogen oxidase
MIVIVGGGISGLSLAYYLQKQGVAFKLIEQNKRTGGYIRSIRQKEYLFEEGPNSLLVDAEIQALLDELNLTEEIVEANPASKKRYILRKGQYRALPSSPPALLFNGFFSWKAKLDIFREMSRPPAPQEGEHVADFFERRFGKEVVDYAVTPFVSGIYAGDPYRLRLDKVFPQMPDYEKTYGSVLKGFIKNKGGARRRSLSFRNGMQTLPERLTQAVKEHLLLQTTVERIEKQGSEWLVHVNGGEIIRASHVVLTVGAHQAARLLPEYYTAAKEVWQQVYYPPLAVVHSAYYKHQFKQVPEGFGALHPIVENSFSLGSIWSSSLFPERCKDNEVLITTFVGGALQPNKAQYEDRRIMHEVNLELKQLLHIQGVPVLQSITRWEKAIPQYHDYMDAVEAHARQLQSEGIYVSANWIGGVSIPDCIKKGKRLAETLAQTVKTS